MSAARTSGAFGLADQELDRTRALILHAYFGLRCTRPGPTIGTQEIHQWIKSYYPDAEIPSDAVIQRTVVAAGLAHRGPGKPRNDSREAVTEQATPFLPVRRQAPRMPGRK